MPPTVNAVWVGDELGPIAAACLRSFVRMGHRTCLHAYDRVKDLPPGVELVDAAKIIERSKIVRHKKTGSFALFSDLYRYELLARGEGIYIDCDVYCVRPIRSREYVMGYERDGAINGAILAMPSDCLLLAKLCRAATGPSFIPPWLKPEKRIIHKLGYLLGLGRSAHSMPWGTFGPHALTYYVKELGLQNEVCPQDVFYPLDHGRISLLFDPELTIEDISTHRTECIHLYNELLRRRGTENIPPTSPLGRMLRASA